jgi:hypothetical protein
VTVCGAWFPFQKKNTVQFRQVRLHLKGNESVERVSAHLLLDMFGGINRNRKRVIPAKHVENVK